MLIIIIVVGQLINDTRATKMYSCHFVKSERTIVLCGLFCPNVVVAWGFNKSALNFNSRNSLGWWLAGWLVGYMYMQKPATEQCIFLINNSIEVVGIIKLLCAKGLFVFRGTRQSISLFPHAPNCSSTHQPSQSSGLLAKTRWWWW